MNLPQTTIIDREAIAEAMPKVKKVNLPEIDSLADAVEMGNGDQSKNWGSYRSSQTRCKKDGWHGTISWPACRKLVAAGWVEGREKVAAQLTEIFDSGAAALAAGEAVAHAVGGAYPDVPLYVAGEVCHMVDNGEQLGEKPIIKLIVNVSASAGIKSDRLINRGAAITALVDQIESAGNSCEIYAVEPTRTSEGDFVTAPMVKVKTAGEVVSIDDIAFALGHPSMLRRVFFALMEIDPATDGHSLHSGYGVPIDLPAAALPADAIYLRGVNHDASRYRTAASSMEFVREIYNKQAEDNGLQTAGGAL